jgi:Ca-activated chloride channel family protein
MKTSFKLLSFTSAFVLLMSCNSDFGGLSGNYMSDNMQDEQPTEKYKDYDENQFVKVSDQAISTFSVDADGGAYANMRRFMNLGQLPPKAAVRIEEFINYFTFNYPEPTDNENVGLNSELSVCPWNTEHHLLRVGMKGKTIPDAQLPNSNFVFLIDVSGSMGAPEKLAVLKSGFNLMVDNLRDNDKVAIVTYAGAAAVLLNSTNGDRKSTIKNAIAKLGAGGSTAGAEGIITAYEIAMKNFIPNGNNRIIIGSDGDFNVGPSTTDELVKLVEEKRKSGVYITVLGVGTGNLNDNMMEQIANKGNGNYEYIDGAQELAKIFINEKAKFYTVAKDSKIQITFNPDKVSEYRLIGYENRALTTEDFVNDTIDAGEIGSSQTITALYELVLTDNTSAGNYAQFDFRYKKPNETESRLLQHTINSEPQAIATASENMRFAASITSFGLILKESKFKGTANKKMVEDLGKNAKNFDPNAYRSKFLNIVSDWKE